VPDQPAYRAPDVSLVGDEHVRRYQETGGREGYLWNGVPILLLTTTGRRSGVPTKTRALIFGRDGADYLVVASKGGSPEHPVWYENLQAHPRAWIQVRDRHLEVEAHTAEGAEHARLWEIMRTLWPNYDVYQTRTDRRIPVVVLRPIAERRP